MVNKLILFLFLIAPLLSNSQEYVDILDVSYSKSDQTAFDNSSDKTVISIFDSKILTPIVLNKETAIITGFDFSIKDLQLDVNTAYSKLYYTRIKLGVNSQHSERWSGIYVLLPIISSDYKKLSLDDVYMGALAVLTYKKHARLNYKFGVYTGNEAFGFYVTPLVGLYYLSPNSNFEFSGLLPGLFDLNYRLSPKTKVGIDYKGSSEGFKIHDAQFPNSYVENNTLEFASYLQNNALIENILFRLKVGFTTNTYEVYAIGDKIDLSITPLKFGDNRTVLNSVMEYSPMIKLQAIYRFSLNTK
jgi:hypothetical protein